MEQRADATTANRITLLTVLILALALLAPPLYALVVRPLVVQPNTGETVEVALGLAVMWLLALTVILLARRFEHRPWGSLGVAPLSWRWVLAAIGIGIALSLLVPVLTLATAGLFPASGEGTIGSVATAFPWPVLLISVVTAAVTEEVLFRAYAMETLLRVFRSRVVAVVVPLVFFTATHANGWNPAHVIGVVIPLGLALSLLYLWRRNLLFVIIAHLVVDLPLVVIAAGATIAG